MMATEREARHRTTSGRDSNSISGAPWTSSPRASISTWTTCTGCFPELHLDLLCHGPIETGRDASHGGVEFYNLCVDGAGLATVADSFAALEQRVEKEGRLTWNELLRLLDTDWAGTEGERARLMMKKHPALRERRIPRRCVRPIDLPARSPGS